MTRGVGGTWYCCDMIRVAPKEWNGGKAGSRPIKVKQYCKVGYILLKEEGRVVLIDWALTAILTITRGYCRGMCGLVECASIVGDSENQCRGFRWCKLLERPTSLVDVVIQYDDKKQW